MIPVGIDCSGEVPFVDSPEKYNKLGNVAQYYKLNIADHDLEYCEKRMSRNWGEQFMREYWQHSHTIERSIK
jgi:hypothetical protein